MSTFEEKYEELAPELFRDVQMRFGRAKRKWSLNEINYGDERPGLNYPIGFMMAVPREFKYDITLTPSTKYEFVDGIYQLSHETLHRLCPTGENTTNNLEEGVAVYYSGIALDVYIGNKEHLEKSLASTKFTGYPYAYKLVIELLSVDKDAIRKLRCEKKHFTKLKKSIL